MKLLLVASILLFSLSALAENKAVKPTGSGSEDDPFLIGKIEHLVWMGENITNVSAKCFRLAADIDASETKNWNNGRGFLPIGYISENSGRPASFCGTFDGGGHVISNLFINRKKQPASFFAKIGMIFQKRDFSPDVIKNLTDISKGTAVIKDLALVDCNFVGKNLAAGLSDEIEYALISRVYISGTLKSDRLTAGIAEKCENSCLDECEIDLKFDNRFSDAACFFSSSKNAYLKNCLSLGSFQYSQDPTYEKSLKLKYTTPLHRLSPYHNKRPLSCFSITLSGEGRLNLYNCLVLNSLLSTKRKYWLYCFSNSEDLQNSFYSTDNLQKDPKDEDLGGLPNSKLMDKSTYVGWDFDSVWEIEDGKSFPKLRRIEKMLKR